jgi:alpha-glucosidase
MKALGVIGTSIVDHALVCALQGGGSFSVRMLGDTLARVTLKPAAGFKEPRTWAIAPVTANSHTRSADVPWEGRERERNDGHTAPQVFSSPSELTTASLRVTVATEPLRLTWSDAKTSAPIFSDRATSSYYSEQRTGATRHYVTRQPDDRFYGLGDKTGPLNLAGRRLRTIAMDSLGYDPEHGDPLYKHWPFLLSRTASGKWVGTYYDTLCACTFDLGAEHDNYHDLYRYVEIDDGDLDYYVMVGDTPADVIAQWMKLIGGTHLPPRWSLGYAQTAMGLADAPDAQAQLDGFIDKVVAHNVPISAFHYGSGYSSRGKRRYVFTWNHEKFPDPKTLNAKFAANGMHTVANIKPCLLDDHPAYADVNAFDGFLRDANSGAPIIEPFWDGVGSHLDFTQPKTIAWWQADLNTALLDYGMNAGWNDNNEYAVLDEDARSAGFAHAMPVHRSRPLHALLMTRATFEAQAARTPTEPTFTVTRGGAPGLQRYAQTWTGDNFTDWRNLKWNIRTGLQMSLSGMFNIGHDVGGFHGPVPDPELFVRWVQACCLNPRMVMNSWKAGNVSNVPWMHPSATPDVIAAIQLRYRLLPYLWSLFEAASRDHTPIIRPTFYDFPDDARCYDDCDEFMLGSQLLVAPVVAPGDTTRSLYLPTLPPGEQWFDFYSKRAYAAGQTHTVDAPLSKLPVFARSGATIPVAAPRVGVRATHDDPVVDTLRF